MSWVGLAVRAIQEGQADQANEADQINQAEIAYRQILSIAGTPPGRRVATRTLSSLLVEQVAWAWQRGWQPADVHRFAGRALGANGQAILGDAMAAELAQYAALSVPARWWGQLREINASVWWPGDADPVQQRAELADGLDALLPHVVQTIATLGGLPTIERLDPLPGQPQTPTASTGESAAVDERILSRVRALLAKAESTSFEAEADTFTAGAQALMARHSISAAILSDAARGATAPVPGARRIGIDRPYERPKVLLLNAVADANRCRTVWTQPLGFVTVVGFDADLQSVETLFTSLLIQSTRAMTSEGRRTGWAGRSRTRSFRQTFLTAFASRIGERLRQVTAEEESAATARRDAGDQPRGDLVRVLAACSEQVDDAVSEMFPRVVARSLWSGTDPEGWQAGTRAADAATLFGGQVEGASA